VPLTAFDVDQFDADLTIVKQLIIQFEADGSAYIDDVKVVPLEGGFTKETEVSLVSAPLETGSGFDVQQWNNTALELENAKVWISLSNTHMFIHAEITDSTPLSNRQQGNQIWNGDALELAFATNPDADNKRKMFFLTDQHIVIRANDQPIVWDIRKDKPVDAQVETARTPNGYMVGAAIPLSGLNAVPLKAGKVYGLEVAVDDGDSRGVRQNQYRWNNPGNEGFHINPAMWGRMHVVTEFSQQ
jgi:hypothetical protein